MASSELSTIMNIIGSKEEMRPRERCIRMSSTGYVQIRGWNLSKVVFTPEAQLELKAQPKDIQEKWSESMRACMSSFKNKQ